MKGQNSCSSHCAGLPPFDLILFNLINLFNDDSINFRQVRILKIADFWAYIFMTTLTMTNNKNDRRNSGDTLGQKV